jgi:hypothetical protein
MDKKTMAAVTFSLVAGVLTGSRQASASTPSLLWENVDNGEFSTWNLACTSTVQSSTTLTNASGSPIVAPTSATYDFPSGGASFGGSTNPAIIFAPPGTFMVDWTTFSSGQVVSTQMAEQTLTGWLPVGQGRVTTSSITPSLMWMIGPPTNVAIEQVFSNGITQIPPIDNSVNITLPTYASPSPRNGNGGTIFTSDFNDDGQADLVLWNKSTGALTLYLLNSSATVEQEQTVGWTCNGSCQSSGWSLYGASDVNCDGYADLVWWNRSTGQVSFWLLNGSGGVESGPVVSWTCNSACQAGGWWLEGVVTL